MRETSVVFRFGRRALLGVLVCLPVASGQAQTFDCGLAADRIADQLKDIRSDVTEYEAIEADLAAKRGALIDDREAARLQSQRQIAAYIRKTMPSKLDLAIKEIRQARSRACLTDARAREITSEATDAAATVLERRT